MRSIFCIFICRCPLYSDTDELHLNAIKRSAEDAKKELGINNNDDLKIDPIQDIEKHYPKKAKTQQPAADELQRNLILVHQHLRREFNRQRYRPVRLPQGNDNHHHHHRHHHQPQPQP